MFNITTFISIKLSPITLQVHDIEFTQVEIQVVEGLKGGNEALEALHQIMSLDDVERIMGDTEDAIEYQRVCYLAIQYSRLRII